MKNKRGNVRSGMASVLAMMYLALVAALAVGFYAAITTSGSIANNEQFVKRAETAAEAGLAFGRYETSQIYIPYFTTRGNVLSAVLTAIGNYTNLNSSSNMNSNWPTNSGTAISIPGSSTWMSVDGLGGLASITVTPTSTANSSTLIATSPLNLTVNSVGENANNTAANAVSSANSLVTRYSSIQISPSMPPLLDYGLVSYGELSLTPASGAVTVTGPGSTPPGVFVAVSGSTPPVNSVTGSNSFAGDFYWTNSTAGNWNSLKIDGYTHTQTSSFNQHIHASQPFPPPLGFDTSGFAQYVGTSAGYTNYTQSGNSPITASATNVNLAANATTTAYTISGAATIGLSNITLNAGTGTTTITITGTHVSLNNLVLNPGTYAFTYTQPITVNGIMELNNSTGPVNITFTSTSAAATLTLNGSLIQQNTSGNAGTISFNGTATNGVVQNSISTAPAPITSPENTLTGTSFLLPTETITFNEPVTTAETMVIGGIQANKAITITNGSLINLGTTANFNTGASVNVNPAAATKLPAGINFGFAQAVSSTYTEN
jgi:hypothetical protein